MEITKNISALINATAKKIELQNVQSQQKLRCQSCQLPYICLQNVVAPVFSSFFGRKYISEELYSHCTSCVLVVALPEPLTEDDIFIMKRKIERRFAKVTGQVFANVIKKKTVFVTCEYVYIQI